MSPKSPKVKANDRAVTATGCPNTAREYPRSPAVDNSKSFSGPQPNEHPSTGIRADSGALHGGRGTLSSPMEGTALLPLFLGVSLTDSAIRGFQNVAGDW